MAKALLATMMVASLAVAALAGFVPTSQYQASGLFRLPYADIVEPWSLQYDAIGNRMRLDYYGGLNTYIFDFHKNEQYALYPMDGVFGCQVMTADGNDMQSVFPDFSKFVVNGTDIIDGEPVNRLTWTDPEGDRVNYYNFYTNSIDGSPVQFSMLGYDVIFGSHYDEYYVDYLEYLPGSIDEALFAIPPLCQAQVNQHNAKDSSANQKLSFIGSKIPQAENKRAPLHEHFTHFEKKHGKTYASSEERSVRMNIFAANRARIEEHNRQNLHVKLALNHFADMTHEEFKARHSIPIAEFAKKSTYTPSLHERQYSDAALPASIDWRTKGAVSAVKDQGDCGSCWTFSATGALEGQWALAGNDMTLFSEQQIVDCAWYNGNAGCGGGMQGLAYEALMRMGGIATEGDYPYLMVNGFCNPAAPMQAKISHYVNVTANSEQALMDALASVGPIAISIDASHESLVFYSSGIYREAACKNDPNDLDHAVLAVGYGTDANGVNYWIVKNSWSTHWGDQGYAYFLRDHSNMCGVTTGPLYPVLA